jgi:sugar lactone lactonase YvrE
MNDDVSNLRGLAAVVALLTLIGGIPSLAWCGGQDLWLGTSSVGGIEAFTPAQLKKRGRPKPVHLHGADGFAFDNTGNLWAITGGGVGRFTPSQLKNLKNDPSPTPGVIITSSSLQEPIGCVFDPQGNLWVLDFIGFEGSIQELSKTQLAAGSGSVTPAKVLTSSALAGEGGVRLTFDEAGNAWVSNPGLGLTSCPECVGLIFELTASQLNTGGDQTASVMLYDDGSGTSIASPGELAFDQNGNLWVPNYKSDTVVEFAKAQLTTSGNPVPIVKLSSHAFDGPDGLAFDTKGNLAVYSGVNGPVRGDGTIAKFTAKQLTSSGSPVPKVIVRGLVCCDSQIIFGPE